MPQSLRLKLSQLDLWPWTRPVTRRHCFLPAESALERFWVHAAQDPASPCGGLLQALALRVLLSIPPRAHHGHSRRRERTGFRSLDGQTDRQRAGWTPEGGTARGYLQGRWAQARKQADFQALGHPCPAVLRLLDHLLVRGRRLRSPWLCKDPGRVSVRGGDPRPPAHGTAT